MTLRKRQTGQIVTFHHRKLEPQGTIVVIEPRHPSVEMRGVKKAGVKTVASAIRGLLLQRPVREEFLDPLPNS